MEPVSDELWFGVNQKDPEPMNITKEQQLIGFTAVSCQFEEDEDTFLLSQLDLYQPKDRDLPNSSATDEVKAVTGKWNDGGADGTRSPDLNHYEDDSSSSETEIGEVEENDQDENSSDSSVIFLSASEPKTKDRTNDWNESRSSSIRVNKESAAVKQKVDSSRKVQAPLIFSKSGQITSQNISLSTATEQKALSCEICEETFILKTHLYKHRRGHTEQKRFSCKLCGQRFSVKAHLKNHMKIHTGERPFVCELCGNSFRKKLTLKIHKRAHTGEKPFACEQCEQTFSSKAGLNSHIRVHTGEKPYTCEHCGRKFSQKENLNSHTRIHLGHKPFVCERCGKRFTQSSHLNTHMRIHQRIKTVV